MSLYLFLKTALIGSPYLLKSFVFPKMPGSRKVGEINSPHN